MNAAPETPCPCEALRETVDSMLRSIGKNAANVDEPVAAVTSMYRALLIARSERDQLRAELTEAHAMLDRIFIALDRPDGDGAVGRLLELIQAEAKMAAGVKP